jgi:hypothetical protein
VLQVWAILLIVTKWISDSDMPEALEADEMGHNKTFISVQVALICDWLTEKIVMGMLCISKKHFHLGGMALSEWTHSVRAVRNTLVADYSTRGVNATRRIAYCPLNAVLPFLLALSVS